MEKDSINNQPFKQFSDLVSFGEWLLLHRDRDLADKMIRDLTVAAAAALSIGVMVFHTVTVGQNPGP